MQCVESALTFYCKQQITTMQKICLLWKDNLFMRELICFEMFNFAFVFYFCRRVATIVQNNSGFRTKTLISANYSYDSYTL